MIGEHAYGELLEACLAINLAYLALDRFRYREAITRIIEKADSHVAGIPEASHVDMAYENWTSVRNRRGPESPLLEFVYKRCLNNGLDRKVIAVAATLSFLVIIYRVFALGLPKVVPFETYWEWPLVAYLIIVTAFTALMISIGRRCVHNVAENVIRNLDHLGEKYLKDNEPAFEAMEVFIEEVRQTHIGVGPVRNGERD
jgi:hypothetical protein